MTERIARASPALEARIAGGLWLIVIAASAVAFIPLSTPIARHDAAATAHGILANESLYRLSIAAELVASISSNRFQPKWGSKWMWMMLFFGAIPDGFWRLASA